MKNERPADMKAWGSFLFASHQPYRRILYCAWLFWPFIALLLPLLKRKLIGRITKKYPGMSVSIGTLRCSMAPGIRAGNVQIKGFETDGTRVDMVAPRLEVNVSSRGLRKGIVACSISMHEMQCDIRQAKTNEEKEVKPAKPGARTPEPPLVIDVLKISKATIRYTAQVKDSLLEVRIDKIMMQAFRVSLLPSVENLPASVSLLATVFGGVLNAEVKASLRACSFDLEGQVEHVDLFKLNNLLKTLGRFDVHEGQLSLYTQATGRDGRYHGYIKPVIHDLKLAGPEDKHDSLLNRIWEGLLSGVASLLKNKKHDQLAARIEFDGRYDIRVHVVQAILQALRNAFVKALVPGFDFNMPRTRTSKEGADGGVRN